MFENHQFIFGNEKETQNNSNSQRIFKKSLFIPDKQIFLALKQESHSVMLCVVMDFVQWFWFVPLKTINKNSLPELLQWLDLAYFRISSQR